MSRLLSRHRIVGTAAYVGTGLAIMFFKLMPLSPGEARLPGPDLMMCITLAWVLRRPDQLPAVIIAALALIGDLMLGRPFGLWSLMVLIATELLRPRAQRWADQPFLFEWLRVAVLMGLMVIGNRLIMALFLLPLPALGPIMLQWLASVMAYPLVVAAVRSLGVRRLSAAELEMMGS
ncbi:rod shape-determining protein MreD [Paracoccus aurantiacus]|uniref:Rod shape-determining protein MreD n=1 Tax=Paracoccus aurantiacus TaxID=2599412 RepID=A0A5C6S4Q2_9RHOB|nr:rod shape-determining protein MreD [Paracoccus aurantiacus]TXB68563.1 rod shape-determining protein MreD [Paracoccus aurantiacus]